MSSINENANDRLSTLPEEVVSLILSLMPTKFAVRTSVLSKSWRYSWMLVTNLDFDDIHTVHGLEVLSKFVDRVLEFCQTPQVNLFRLNFYNKYYWLLGSTVSSWIDKVVRLKVQELDIQVNMFKFPVSLFTCNTLIKLRIDRENRNDSTWRCPCLVNLPCLKTLDIAVFDKPHQNAFKLIRGCPVLESLFLTITKIDNAQDYVFNIPTLKQMRLTMRVPSINRVVLNVPNLEYLFVGGVLCSRFVIEDVSSLVEASFSFIYLGLTQLLIKLLKGISGVESLSVHIASPLQHFEIPLNSPFPIFPNMTHLELKGFRQYGKIIPQFLESSPGLKHLCIEKVDMLKQPRESLWIEPKLVPLCLLTNLTTIRFSKCEKRKFDIEFLKYMLRNAMVLKTITIIWHKICSKEERRLCKQLLNAVPRASIGCEIQ